MGRQVQVRKIKKNEAEQRLDRFMKKYFKDAPLSLIFRMIRKDVKVNGKRVPNDTMIHEGDQISFYISDETFKDITKARKVDKVNKIISKREFSIVYEDDNLLVVNKPTGLLMHGDSSEKKRTLTNQVIEYLIQTDSYFPRLETTFRPASVNRLDRNTSGLAMFGKNFESLRSLNKLMRAKGSIQRFYYAIVSGEIKEEMSISTGMERDKVKNKTYVVVDYNQGGIVAMKTEVRPIAVNNGYSFVGVELITGKTHQIRTHLQFAGHPLIGDEKYGNPKINDIISNKYGLNHQWLHAHKIFFEKTTDNLKYLEGRSFEADLPLDLQFIAKDLGLL